MNPAPTGVQSVRRPAAIATSVAILPVIRWALYALAFSIPFEFPDGPLPVTLPTLASAVLFLAALLQPSICFRRPNWAFWCFAAYLAIASVSEFLYGRVELAVVGRSMLLRGQLILLFWIVGNLLRNEETARRALFSFAVGCMALAGLQIAGIATTVETYSRKPQRISAFGMNKNYSALFMAEGALALIGVAYGRRAATSAVSRAAALPLVALLGAALVQNGSRGGLLAVTAGLATFVLGKRDKSLKLQNAFVVLAVIAFLAVGSFRSETMRTRIESTLEYGDITGRDQIFQRVWGMFLDHPWLGWGMVSNKYELGARLLDPKHEKRDAHNLLFEVLTTGGVIGAVPFLLGIGLCVRSAWRARAGSEGIVPLAMTAAILVGNMSGNRIAAELFWFVLAYAAASGCRVGTVPRARFRSRPARQGAVLHDSSSRRAALVSNSHSVAVG
jgi:O-antigen ligase